MEKLVDREGGMPFLDWKSSRFDSNGVSPYGGIFGKSIKLRELALPVVLVLCAAESVRDADDISLTPGIDEACPLGKMG